MRRKYTQLPFTEYPVIAYDDESHRLPIDTIILHSTNSTYMSAVNWFNNPNAGTSAHYVISNNGDLAAMLEEYFVAFASGNYLVNQKSINIEHEGYVGMVRSDKEYEMSIKLVADICKFYSIPADNIHIKPHRDIVATSCPTDLDINRIINGAKALVSGTPTPPSTDPCQLYKDQVSFRDKVIGERDATIVNLNAQVTNLQKQLSDTTTTLLTTKADLVKCQSQPIPPAADCSNYINLIAQARSILYGKGWWFSMVPKLRAIIPKV